MAYLYFWGEQPKSEIPDMTKMEVVADTLISKADTSKISALPDSLVSKQHIEKFADFAVGATGKEEDIVLENKDIQVTVSTKGAYVKKVLLKNYFTWDKKPLYLIDQKTSNIDLKINAYNKEINLSELYYSPNLSKTADSQTVTFKLELAGGKSIEHIYSLNKEGFLLNYNLRETGLDNAIRNVPLLYSWKSNLPNLEYDLKQSRDRSTVNYYLADGSHDFLTEASTDEQFSKLESAVKWVSLKNKFFNSAIIAKNTFEGGDVKSKVFAYDSSSSKYVEANLFIPVGDLKTGKANYTYFFGPNKYDICNGVTDGFEENVNLGWPVIKWINRFVVIPVFNFLSSFIANYGIIIIILVLLLKLILFPLSYKSYVAMAKMKVMKPELDELKAKYPDDMQKQQSEQMQLYQKVGINPLSGCIPVLLQMPILLAMFSFFPNSIELRGESFLWATDLSTYDHPIMLPFEIPFYGSHVSIFTLFMTISTLVYTWFNNQMSTVQGPMKIVSYVMPVVFMFVLNSFPAGLSFYYFVSNIVTIGQQVIIRRFVDEDQIKLKLEENRKANVEGTGTGKKSKFMQRLDDAMKAQEELKKKKK